MPCSFGVVIVLQTETMLLWGREGEEKYSQVASIVEILKLSVISNMKMLLTSCFILPA
jgi:hypothetical protein